MTDTSARATFDLSATIKPLSLELPQLGSAIARVRTAGFLVWFERGKKAGRWPDGKAFVKALLRDRVSPSAQDDKSDSAPGFGAEVVEAFDDETLEAAAAALLLVCSPVFRQRFKGTREQEATVEESGIPEAPSTQLLTAALTYYDAYTASVKDLTDRLSGTGVARKLWEESGVSGKLARQSGVLAGLGSSVGQINQIGHLSGGILDALSRGQIGGLAGALTSESAILRMQGGGLLASLGQLSATESALTRMQRSALWGSRSALRDSVLERAMGSRSSEIWDRRANDYLGLGLSKSILDIAGGLTPTSSLATIAERQAASLLRPGFQSIAGLAINGAIARGAAADLLHEYDYSDLTAPLFSSVIEYVSAFDDPEITPAQRLSRLNNLLHMAASVREYLVQEYQKAGLVALLGTVIAVIALFQNQLPWNQAPAPAPDRETIKAVTELKGLRGDLKASRDADTSDIRYIRYLHDRAYLRVEPERGGLLIRIVYPDQWVKVLDTRGDWARVAVYDYASDNAVEGWLYRRNLRQRPLGD